MLPDFFSLICWRVLSGVWWLPVRVCGGGGGGVYDSLSI